MDLELIRHRLVAAGANAPVHTKDGCHCVCVDPTSMTYECTGCAIRVPRSEVATPPTQHHYASDVGYLLGLLVGGAD